MRLRDPDHLRYAVMWPRWFLTYPSEMAFDVTVITIPVGSRACIPVMHFVPFGPTTLALVNERPTVIRLPVLLPVFLNLVFIVRSLPNLLGALPIVLRCLADIFCGLAPKGRLCAIRRLPLFRDKYQLGQRRLMLLEQPLL
jgi:hypothetical protein